MVTKFLDNILVKTAKNRKYIESGASIIEYVVLAGLIFLACVVGVSNVGGSVSSLYENVNNAVQNISNTEPGTGSGDGGETGGGNNPDPDLYSGEAYALYFEEDHSFVITRSETELNDGDTYNGKTITNAYPNIETEHYSISIETRSMEEYPPPPWWLDSINYDVINVVIEKPVKPISPAVWFNNFSNCSSITGLENINTSNVIDMYCMFNGCSSIESLNGLEKWDTANVANMGMMFESCGSLTTISDISGWDTSNSTNMSRMFYWCGEITSLGGIHKWDTRKVEYMHEMFYHCEKLTADISSWNIDNVVSNYYFNFLAPGVSSPFN